MNIFLVNAGGPFTYSGFLLGFALLSSGPYFFAGWFLDLGRLLGAGGSANNSVKVRFSATSIRPHVGLALTTVPPEPSLFGYGILAGCRGSSFDDFRTDAEAARFGGSGGTLWADFGRLGGGGLCW